MEKRKMTGIGTEVSRLGMGLMRLPVKDGEIDFPAARDMIDKLMESGVTYYDTAYFYHGGKSEDFARRALIERYPRDKFTIATKLPIGQLKEPSDTERVFNEQLGNLGVDFVDFYLLHGIGLSGWEKAKELGADKFQQKMKQEGKIKYAGFSFHGKKEDLPVILDEGKWDFVQIQLNYYDWYAGDAKTLYEEIKKRGIAVIVMEPVRGGRLVNMHADALECIKPAGTPASAALRWVADLEGVDVVLSGMSNMEQADENISLFTNREPLGEANLKLVEKTVQVLRALPIIPCTGCNYCDKCPQGIGIPRLLDGYNEVVRFGSSWVMSTYFSSIPEEKRASACVECGVCEAACPQGIKVIEELKKVHAMAVETENKKAK